MPCVVAQVLDDHIALERAMGHPVRGLSYPNGSHSAEIRDMLRHAGIRYSRVVGNSESFELPEDFMRWKATCHHSHRLMELGREFLALSKPLYQYLMYVWGHSFEFDKFDNWALIEDIWYAMNIEIIDSLDTFNRLQFAADSSFVYSGNLNEKPPAHSPYSLCTGDSLPFLLTSTRFFILILFYDSPPSEWFSF